MQIKAKWFLEWIVNTARSSNTVSSVAYWCVGLYYAVLQVAYYNATIGLAV